MSRDGFLTTLMEVDAHDSPAQAFTSEDGVPNARGRVLGGSSAINAGCINGESIVSVRISCKLRV